MCVYCIVYQGFIVTRIIGLLSLFSILLMTACSQKISESGVDEVKPKKSKNVKAAELNIQMGLEYLRQGNMSRAKQKLVTASEQAPNSPDAAGALAYYFEKTGSEDIAKRYYLRALKLAPGKGAQLNNYGAFLCRQGQFQEANKYFESASRDLNYLNSSGALENAGLCALEIPNITMAKRYFKHAIEQDPRRVKSYYELTKLALDAKHYKEAFTWIERFQRTNALRPDMTFLAYQTAIKSGENKKAETFEWILKNRFPESFEYKKLLASRDGYDKRKSSVG